MESLIQTIQQFWSPEFMFVLFIFPLFLGLKNYTLRQKHKLKNKKIIIPQFSLTKNLSPAEIGMLFDKKFDKKDLAAAILQLVVQNFITIELHTNKNSFDKVLHHALVKTNKNADLIQNNLEKSLYDQFFLNHNRFFLEKNALKINGIFHYLQQKTRKNKKLFIQPPNNQIIWTFFIITSVLFMFFANTQWLLLIILICIILLIFIQKKTPILTVHAQQLILQILGFKKFLETAETQKINWKNKQFLFDKNLPYALALGLENKWTKIFEKNIPIPQWFSSPNIKNFISTETSTFPLNLF